MYPKYFCWFGLQDLKATSTKYTYLLEDLEKKREGLKQKDEAMQLLQNQIIASKQEKTSIEIQLRKASTELAEKAAEIDAIKNDLKVV